MRAYLEPLSLQCPHLRPSSPPWLGQDISHPRHESLPWATQSAVPPPSAPHPCTRSVRTSVIPAMRAYLEPLSLQCPLPPPLIPALARSGHWSSPPWEPTLSHSVCSAPTSAPHPRPGSVRTLVIPAMRAYLEPLSLQCPLPPPLTPALAWSGHWSSPPWEPTLSHSVCSAPTSAPHPRPGSVRTSVIPAMRAYLEPLSLQCPHLRPSSPPWLGQDVGHPRHESLPWATQSAVPPPPPLIPALAWSGHRSSPPWEPTLSHSVCSAPTSAPHPRPGSVRTSVIHAMRAYLEPLGLQCGVELQVCGDDRRPRGLLLQRVRQPLDLAVLPKPQPALQRVLQQVSGATSPSTS